MSKIENENVAFCLGKLENLVLVQKSLQKIDETNGFYNLSFTKTNPNNPEESILLTLTSGVPLGQPLELYKAYDFRFNYVYDSKKQRYKIKLVEVC